ncbi:hypothetical protein [Bacillus alkalicellulosilyticus]|uniref:hypothetical protein n=1 Tax=Alkalihalobacterium alkalicellulosilyticum TaxID=1912214 RepID=UPI000998A2C8|nr:hypothetical protein [Bacillus alkalicellulosilyticus]
MKIFLSLSILIILLIGCASQDPLELTKATVEERDENVSGPNEIQLKSLNYEFVLKNNSKKTIGGMEKLREDSYSYEDGIELSIEPSEKLVKILEETIGFNFFEDNGQGGLGRGTATNPFIDPNQIGVYNFHFDLGAIEVNDEIQLAPTQEEMDRLVENALEATLVVRVENEEIARFDLTKWK